jgi:arylsulfatase
VGGLRLSCIVALLLVACGGSGEPGAGAGPARHLVIVSLDTVRADHLPTYGYARDTAPSLADVAREGVVFRQAFTPETNTNPAHTTLFTGVYPHVHGNLSNTSPPLAPGRVTLAQILGDAGFATAGFVSAVTLKQRLTGLGRGFDVWDDEFAGRRRDGAETVERARRWLRERGDDERVFLFVHLYDAHGPYLPPGTYRGLFRSETPGRSLRRLPRYQAVRDDSGELVTALNDYVDRYDAMIRYADDRLAELLVDVDLSETLLVVLSDHGETLGERFHAIDHGGQVFEEQLRIPLVMRGPGIEPGSVDTTARMVDLLPTLLPRLDVPVPDGLDLSGRDLTPFIAGRTGRDVPVFASSRAASARHADRGYRLDPAQRIVSARSGRWKLIVYPGLEQDYEELYDLVRDPYERKNRVEEAPRALARGRELLEEWRAGAQTAPAQPAHQLDDETRRQLEALGYVDE